jgi:uncharacterized protein (TIGR03067 family)
VQQVLDAELSRLPEKYRVPIVLCDLEGRPRKEVARQLGWPEGTLSCRLARGRALLARRLTRHGITLSGGAVAFTLAEQAAAALPAALLAETSRAALAVAAGQTAATGAVSVEVAALTEGVLKTMLLSKLKSVAALVLGIGVLVAGAGVIRDRTAAAQQAAADSGGAIQPAAGGKAPADLRQVPRQLRVAENEVVWTLGFHFKDPRRILADDLGQGKKVCWYLRYEVTNDTGAPRAFIPSFDLAVQDRPGTHGDQVVTDVEKKISQVEDPAGALALKNSVTIASVPIPPAPPGAAAKPVHGVAVWDDVPADANRLTVYVAGLSNAWTTDARGFVLSKTLQLNFKRVGDEMRFAGPPQWVYRSRLLVPAMKDQARKDDKLLEFHSVVRAAVTHVELVKGWQSQAAVNRVVTGIQDALQRLRQQTQDEQAELQALQEIEKQVKEMREKLLRRQEQRKELDKLQGLWEVKKLEAVGASLPAELVPLPLGEARTTAILGDRFIPKGSGSDPEAFPVLQIHPGQAPAGIDFVVRGRTVRGIYELKGDTLRIGLGDGPERPTGFEGTAGRVVITYQRKKG